MIPTVPIPVQLDCAGQAMSASTYSILFVALSGLRSLMELIVCVDGPE